MKSISFEEARAAIDAAEHTRPKSISFEEARAAIDAVPSKQRAFITLDEAAATLNREIIKRPVEGKRSEKGEETEKVEDPKRVSPPSRWTWEAWGQGARDFGKVLGAPARDRRHARKSREGLIAPDSPDFVPTFGMDDPFALERVLRRRKTADERIAQQEGREGLWELIRNPLDAMAHDGAMKRIIERSGGLTFGSLDRLGMDIGEHKALEEHEARQLASRQKILANPEQFPAKTVEMAQLAQREHGEKESKTFMQQAGEVTSALYEGVTERPEEIGAALVNAIFADPWVVGAPVGVGLKPVKAARAAVGITGTSRAVTTTDKIADAALVGGAANLLIESQVAQEQARDITPGELAASFAIGAGASGVINAVGQVISRGKAARETILTGKPITEADYQKILTDLEVEKKVTDRVLRSPAKFDPTVVNRINELVGIKPRMTVKEAAVARAKYQKELNEAFSKANQQKYDAEQALLLKDRQARRDQFAKEFELALAQRGARAAESAEAKLAADAEIAAKARRLDEEEIITAAYENAPAVRQAMEQARKRDARLAVPKWKRGSVDPRLLARMGAASLFGTAAYIFAEEDYKPGTALLAGLAGLVLPGGGRVINVLKQTGAITFDGDAIPPINFRRTSDKLAASKGEAPKSYSQIIDEDFATIQKVIKGDQAAFKQLYTDYLPTVIGTVRKKGAKIAPLLGMELEDMVQEIMVSIVRSLPNYKPVAPFGAFIQDIAKKRIKDYLDKLNATKREGDLQTISIYKSYRDKESGSAEAGHIVEAKTPMYDPLIDTEQIAIDADWASLYQTTPENAAIRDQAVSIINNTIDRMNPRMRQSFEAHHEHGLSPDEIAVATGQDVKAVYEQISTAEELITNAVSKGLNARKRVEIPKPELTPGRGRGRPKKQTGEIDRGLLKTIAFVSGAAATGLIMNRQNLAFDTDFHPSIWGAAIFGGAALLLSRKNLRGVTYRRRTVEQVADKIGVTSTEIRMLSPKIWGRSNELEAKTRRLIHQLTEATVPFSRVYLKLPPITQSILNRAIKTGRPEVTNNVLQAIGDKDLIDGWRQVRVVLDNLRDQQVALGRFFPSDFEYFPRVVKDIQAFRKAIGADDKHPLTILLKDADVESLANAGRALNDIEASVIVNRYLMRGKIKGGQPSWAKERVIEDIPPELEHLYHDPIETLHGYIHNVVEDIEIAKFFGKDLAVTKKEGKVYTNVDKSIGNIIRKELDAGMSQENTDKLTELLRDRYMYGQRIPSEAVRVYRDLTYITLIAQFDTAVQNLSDIGLQMVAQDYMPVFDAIVRTLTGRKLVHMKDYGLQDYITYELIGKGITSKYLDKSLRLSAFTTIDVFSKNVALNAAIIKARKQAKTLKGLSELEAKWGEVLPQKEFEQFIDDLRSDKITDLVHNMAFAELARTQPISKLEMTPFALRNPNVRALYILKSFPIKQLDFARIEVYNNIKAGNVSKGVKKAFDIVVAMSLAGIPISSIRNYLLGRDTDVDFTDFTDNIMKVYGLSNFFRDRFMGVSKEEAAKRRLEGDIHARPMKPDPIPAVLGLVIPPYKLFTDLYNADPSMIRYLPPIGRIIHSRQREAEKELAAQGESR